MGGVKVMHDIFGPGSNVERRIVTDYLDIQEKIEHCKALGFKIVLTSGTFDLFHEGHARYLEEARRKGNLLIVGIDDDNKVRRRKGKHRPIVSQRERMEILCHVRHVDLVFLKSDGDPKWELTKRVRPDILVATQETYTDQEIRALEEFCGEVVVLPPQAATSTTARIRSLLIGTADEVKVRLEQAVGDVVRFLDELTRGS